MLEPDYYQLFPCFTERTTIDRLLRTDLVNATFLLMCNIDKLLITDKGRIEVYDFLRKDFGAQRLHGIFQALYVRRSRIRGEISGSSGFANSIGGFCETKAG